MSLTFTISRDRLRCEISGSASAEERSLRLEQASERLAAVGIRDATTETLEAVVQAAASGRTLENYLVATGTPASLGRDGEIHWLIDPSLEELAPGREDARGRIDFRMRREFVAVEAGQLLGRWTPPEPGQPGLDVTGRPIPARPVKENPIQVGRNVTLSEDGTEARAAVDGHALVSGRRVSVDRLHRVEGDLDYRTGHLRYAGSVQVSGDVRPGFRVEADGDLVVAGSCERAELRAAGSVTVHGGIVGGSRVLAGANIAAGRVLESHLEAGDRITVRDSLVGSTTSSRTLEILGSARSGLVGGMANAAHSIKTQQLGSRLGVRTTVRLGHGPRQLVESIRLRQSLAELGDEIRRVEGFLAAARGRPPGTLAPLEAALAAKGAQAAAAAASLRALDAALDPGARLTVRGTVHDGVEIWIGVKHLSLELERERVVFQLAAGEIVVGDLGGEP
jgi:uncharacterized protein (DUF342 family)